MPSRPAFSQRPAVADDREFLAQLYATTRSEELDAAGFPFEQRAAFCRMQFEAQQKHYELYFARAVDQLIVLSESPQAELIGRELVARAADEIFLVDIALLPAYRGQGIGSVLLNRLFEQSAQQQCPVRLYAVQGSRAQQLYQRHGFRVMEEEGLHFLMERNP
jgi:ribosomal protein S18 acetylase RimI-like enzyme